MCLQIHILLYLGWGLWPIIITINSLHLPNLLEIPLKIRMHHRKSMDYAGEWENAFRFSVCMWKYFKNSIVHWQFVVCNLLSYRFVWSLFRSPCVWVCFIFCWLCSMLKMAYRRRFLCCCGAFLRNLWNYLANRKYTAEAIAGTVR